MAEGVTVGHGPGRCRTFARVLAILCPLTIPPLSHPYNAAHARSQPPRPVQARAAENQRRRLLPRGRLRHRGRRAREHRPPVRRRLQDGRAARRSSSAAATSSAARPSPRTATSPAPPPTTWACSPPSSTPLALQETMEKMGQPTRVLSAISVYSVCEPFIRRRAVRHLEKGRADHPRRRHRQPLLHHRHLRRPARHRDRGRRAPEGHQGRRHLLRRPEEGHRPPSSTTRSPTSRSTATSSA